MDALARWRAGLIVLLMAAIAPTAIPASAQPSSGDGEVYVADVREAPPELGLRRRSSCSRTAASSGASR